MELPDKLSDLIIVALDELEVIEQHPNYTIDMEWVHGKYINEELCRVGLAGSIIAKDIDYDHLQQLNVEYGGTSNLFKFRALNDIRKYNITDALYEFHGDDISLRMMVTLTQLNFDHPELQYKENAKIFKQNMRKIAQHLSNFNY